MDTEFEYFKWLIESIDPDNIIGEDYDSVLKELYFTNFKWMKKYKDDENRAKDGVYLRTIFMNSSRELRDAMRVECNYILKNGGTIENEFWFYRKPCSCLELLVSIARKIEYDFVAIPGEENIPKWFWRFMDSMGLSPNSEKVKNPRYVSERIDKWLGRRYQRNGEGGIFIVNSDDFDMPKLELRKQMYAVLNEEMEY